MQSIKALFVALLPLVPAVALSQTPIIASNVMLGPVSSIEWKLVHQFDLFRGHGRGYSSRCEHTHDNRHGDDHLRLRLFFRAVDKPRS